VCSLGRAAPHMPPPARAGMEFGRPHSSCHKTIPMFAGFSAHRRSFVLDHGFYGEG
jgi:hypothetical protein